ncbi:MAG: histidine phosphatase family protein [Deltaproteobacteria bacterium]|nr:histidine phosphatase family protein [Deltaproteobacteria bacterium]MBW2420657.1 histidine phosphatase family protein [Deltaproteobacteria bacterium]
MSAILVLVRHGRTEANAEGIWHGSIDTPLSPHGHEQARQVASYIAAEHGDAAALYSSPLQRARNTALAIAERTGLEVALETGLSEYDLGSWEGKTYRELFDEHRMFHHIKTDPDFAPHGGESPRQVVDRLVGALRRIAERHAGQRVVAVSHGGAMTMAFAELLEGSYSSWDRVMSNCGVSELVLDPKPALLSFDHTEHLSDL